MTISLRYAALSDIGRVRKKNQDSGYASSRLLIQADGMGGPPAGDVARDERDAFVVANPLDTPNGRDRRIVQLAELFDPLADRDLEAGGVAELALEAQLFRHRGVGVLQHQPAIAEHVAEAWRVQAGTQRAAVGGPRRIVGSAASWVHSAPLVLQDSVQSEKQRLTEGF